MAEKTENNANNSNLEEAVALVVPRDTESVLLVEDEEHIRAVIGHVLQKHGYKIIPAPDPASAEFLFLEHKEEIRLLLTDVGLPQMSGPELYKRLAKLRPDLKVMYMSAYLERAISKEDFMEDGVPFIPKPFALKVLAQKVRTVLDGAERLDGHPQRSTAEG